MVKRLITYGQIRTATLKILGEFSSRGAVTPQSKNADFNYQIQQIVNESIYELASTTAKLPATFPIAHNPVKNALSDDTSSLRQHLPSVDFSITLLNAKACFFEAIYPATVVLEESVDGVTYTEIETINVTATVLTEYRRLITPSLPTNTVRLRFTNDFVYVFRNYILYPYSWASEAEVQQHRPWFIYTPPANFLDLNYVEIKRDSRQYVPYSNMIKTPENQLAFNSYDGPCEFLIRYWRKPTLLTFTDVQATDDAMVIDLRDDASLIIPYNVAGTIQNSEEANRGDGNLKKYMEKRMNLIPSTTSQTGSIINLYNW